MQVTRAFSGTLSDVGKTSNRQISWGVTGLVTGYQNKVDFINQTIADFLKNDCGVDAVYEVREGSTYKFLWIYGVPFLLSPASASANNFAFYGPLYATALNSGSTSSGSSLSTFFSAYSAGNYSFSLLFTGNPQTGFALRIRPYNTVSISYSFCFKFFKAKNLFNGANSVMWTASAPTSDYYISANGIDLLEDGSINKDSFSTALVHCQIILPTKAVVKQSNPGKLPLVPLISGVWEVQGIYQRPFGFDLPTASQASSETQVEIELSGRKFIVTNSDSPHQYYLCMGLIEVSS